MAKLQWNLAITGQVTGKVINMFAIKRFVGCFPLYRTDRSETTESGMCPNQKSDRIDCWVMSPSATIMADKALLLDESDDYEVLLDFLEEEDDFPVLGAACCFTRRNLNRVVDCFEVTVIINMYSPGEFQSHFRLSRRSFEQL